MFLYVICVYVMFTWSRKSTIIAILTILVVVALVYQAGSAGTTQTSNPTATTSVSTSSTTTSPITVKIISVGTSTDVVNATGEVRGRLSATISSQISGVISKVPTTIGQEVGRSEILAVFENQSEQANVRQAEANVESQQANLKQLLAGPRPEEVTGAELSLESARDDLRTAKRNLFNTDLQAYVASGDQGVRSGSLQAPAISGTYQGDQRGEYRITLYGSGAKSGYSFRYTGLEKGIGTVSTDTPQPLGTKGLYIQFPDDFASNRMLEWVVPIPNTRSSQFIAAKNRLEQAQTQRKEAENNLSLTESGTRQEQIDAARAQLSAAEASLQQAQAQLDKTTVQAPFAGTVLSVPVDAGQFVSVGQPIAKLVNRSEIEIRTALSPQVATQLSVGDAVQIGEGGAGRVVAIAPAVDPDTGNVAVRVTADQADQPNLIPGTYVDLTFSLDTSQQSSRQTLPLSAVGTTADSSYVLVVDDDNTLRRVELKTGAVTGSSVTVAGTFPDEPIVKDISGLSADQEVRAVNSSTRDE